MPETLSTRWHRAQAPLLYTCFVPGGTPSVCCVTLLSTHDPEWVHEKDLSTERESEACARPQSWDYDPGV